jgi:hypothetical protein
MTDRNSSGNLNILGRFNKRFGRKVKSENNLSEPTKLDKRKSLISGLTLDPVIIRESLVTPYNPFIAMGLGGAFIGTSLISNSDGSSDSDDISDGSSDSDDISDDSELVIIPTISDEILEMSRVFSEKNLKRRCLIIFNEIIVELPWAAMMKDIRIHKRSFGNVITTISKYHENLLIDRIRIQRQCLRINYLIQNEKSNDIKIFLIKYLILFFLFGVSKRLGFFD